MTTAKRFSLILLGSMILLASTYVAYGILTAQKTIPSVGTVKTVNVGAYWDETCTDPVVSINWGMIEPASSRNVVVYLKNEGNTPITLSLRTEGWSPPEASTYLTLSWDYTGSEIPPTEFKPTTLILTISESITGITSFSFDIIITGEG